MDRRDGDRRQGTEGSRSDAVPGPRLHQREQALSEIHQMLEGTWNLPQSPIVIEGRLGSGRTSLLNASLRMGEDLGLRVGVARCDPAESSTSFGVVRQIFSSMLHRAAIPDEPMHDGTDLGRRVLRDGLGPAEDPADTYQSLLLLLETTGEHPTLVGVDDVHWADDMSAGWLQFLARRLNSISSHLVLTTLIGRAGFGSGATDRLVLDPSTRRFMMRSLDTESTAMMMRDHLGKDLSQSVVEAAHRATGGNPLLIARMLRALDELPAAAATITERQIDQLTSPVAAQALLSLVPSLPDGALEFLEATAVLGATDLRIAAAVAGIDVEVAGRLADSLAGSGVLSRGRPLDFVHSFERRSLYYEIQPARRSRTHAQAAQILASLGSSVIEIAEHLLESDPSGDEWTTSVLIEAARQSLESGDVEQADQFLSRAGLEAPGNSMRAEVAKGRAQFDGRLGRESAAEHLAHAANLGLDAVSVAGTALDLLDRDWNQSSAAALLEIAQSVRDGLVEEPHMAVRLQLAETVFVPASGGLQRIDDARLVADDPKYQVSVLGRLVAAQEVVSSAARLGCTHDELIATLEPLMTPDLLRSGGLVQSAIVCASLCALVRVGAYEIADPLIQSAMTAAESGGRPIDLIAYSLVLAESLAMQGRLVAAEQLLADTRYEAGGDLGHCVTMERRWFAALREWHDREPAGLRVIATPTTSGLAALGASSAMFLAENTARVKLLEGEWASAITHFDRLASAAERFSVRNPAFAPWRAGRSAALAGLGRHNEGSALASENLELARAFGAPITIAEALACVARFRPPEDQVMLLKEAVGLISGTSAELLRCNLLIDLGFARHHAGDAAEARTAFRHGADHATRLGVTRLAGVAGRGLLACGSRPRRLQMSGLESLTPAELRVVTLAADGHTNGSIASSLFINVKTVESHLTSVYKKLGIADRAELKGVLESPNETDVLDDSDTA